MIDYFKDLNQIEKDKAMKELDIIILLFIKYEFRYLKIINLHHYII